MIQEIKSAIVFSPYYLVGMSRVRFVMVCGIVYSTDYSGSINYFVTFFKEKTILGVIIWIFSLLINLI
jgi:hypothetical protein